MVLEYLAELNQGRKRRGHTHTAAAWFLELQSVRDAAGAAAWSAAPFERTRVPDADLAMHVVTGSPNETDVAISYADIFEQGVSSRERETIIGWVQLVQRCLPDTPEGNARRSTLGLINRTLSQGLSAARRNHHHRRPNCGRCR